MGASGNQPSYSNDDLSRDLDRILKEINRKADFNEQLTAVRKLADIKELAQLINNRLALQERALSAQNKTAQEELKKTEQKFNEQMVSYYKEKQRASETQEQLFRDQMSEKQKMQESIRIASADIDNEIKKINDSWNPTGKALWENKSWAEGIKAQAEHYGNPDKNTRLRDEVEKTAVNFIAQQANVYLMSPADHGELLSSRDKLYVYRDNDQGLFYRDMDGKKVALENGKGALFNELKPEQFNSQPNNLVKLDNEALANRILTITSQQGNTLKANPEKLTPDEIKSLSTVHTKAFQQFKDQLEQLEKHKDNPNVNHLVQLAYAMLARRVQSEMNERIKEINKARREQGKPECEAIVPLSVNKIVEFANNNKAVREDSQQMIQNMYNYCLIESLNNQKKELQSTHQKTMQATPVVANTQANQKISHCELQLQSTVAKTGYDPDKESKHAMYPSYRGLQTMQNICKTIDPNLTVSRAGDPRIFNIKHGNESFQFDTVSNKFIGNNISQSTLKMMHDVMAETYKDRPMVAKSNDPASQPLVAQTLGIKPDAVLTSEKQREKTLARDVTMHAAVTEEVKETSQRTFKRS